METGSSSKWPLFEFAFIPRMDEGLDQLANLAEREGWRYQNTQNDHEKPILYNYLHYTYSRLKEENKIAESDDKQHATFNTGLVTPHQEPLFALFTPNHLSNAEQPWHFRAWCRQGERDLTVFPELPEMAHYFDDPSSLVFDTRRELRLNVEHIVEGNKDRFPEPYRGMENYPLQICLDGAISNAKKRVNRNYKTAIPQYYRGDIQILLPLCLESPTKAELALVVENYGTFYRASTCLTLDMAYSNARLLARPDRDWLQP